MNVGMCLKIGPLFWMLAANRQARAGERTEWKVQQVHRLEILHLVSSEWHKWTRNCSISSLPFAR